MSNANTSKSLLSNLGWTVTARGPAYDVACDGLTIKVCFGGAEKAWELAWQLQRDAGVTWARRGDKVISLVP